MQQHRKFNIKTPSEFQRWNNVGISALIQHLVSSVVTTSEFQRWNNVLLSTLKQTSELQRWNNVSSFTLKQRRSSTLKQRQNSNVETTSEFQRWNNVRVSTSIQLSNPIKIQRHFNIEVRHCSTLGQRWNACWGMIGTFSNDLFALKNLY